MIKLYFLFTFSSLFQFLLLYFYFLKAISVSYFPLSDFLLLIIILMVNHFRKYLKNNNSDDTKNNYDDNESNDEGK